MKKLLLLTLFLCIALQLSAQAPQQFSFQGIARDVTGKIISNTPISLRLTIHTNTILGQPVYQETHSVATSEGGIFTVKVGGGNVASGVFKDIRWDSGTYFLQIEIDPTGGINYVSMGGTQLLSVPYALHAEEAGRWKNDDPIVQTGNYLKGGVLPQIVGGTKLIWYPRVGAFRAGFSDDSNWQNANIGDYSIAFGQNTTASRIASSAFGSHTVASSTNAFAIGEETSATNINSFSSGYQSKATGENSATFGYGSMATGNQTFATGGNTQANGIFSSSFGLASKADGKSAFATGISTHAIGDASTSGGDGTVSKSYGSTALGTFNNIQDNPNGSTANFASPNDRIFQIGNGSSDQNLSNAVTVLRNGNVGFGNNALNPQFILDIGSRPRVRNNPGSSAGIYFDDFNNNPEGFVGMKKSDEIGFYHAGKWSFWVDNLGNTHIFGSNYNTSDKRLKRDFSFLNNSLTQLSSLKGYHYFWKDPTQDQTLQTGLVAQDVETVFPELVLTDDKGFKSVNYTGLIPHLIEAVKELKEENAALKESVSKLSVLEARVNKLLETVEILSSAKSGGDRTK